MMTAMELSLYPLGTNNIGAAVGTFISVLRERGLEISTGPMSSTVYGDSGALFGAVSDAYAAACAAGGVVLVIKASNACLPKGTAAE